MKAGKSVHWIIRLARDSSLPGGAQLKVPPDVTPTEAWQSVMDACGVDENRLEEVMAEWFHLKVADLGAADSVVATLVPGSLARGFNVLPLHEGERYLVVATADPTNFDAEQQIGFASGRSLRLQIAAPTRISEAVEGTYSADRVVSKILDGIDPEPEGRVRDPRVKVLEDEPAPTEEKSEEEGADAGPIVNLTKHDLPGRGDEGGVRHSPPTPPPREE